MYRVYGGASAVDIDEANRIVYKEYECGGGSLIGGMESTYLINELYILNILKGLPGFPQLKDVIEDFPGGHKIIMSYTGITIDNVLYRKDRFLQLVDRLNTLHQHGVVHCDLKPHNITIDAHGVISIIDFSHAHTMFHARTEKGCVDFSKPAIIDFDSIHPTPGYEPPECFKKGSVSHTEKIDLWSLGCVLYEWITHMKIGEWESNDKERIMKHIGKRVSGISDEYYPEEKKWLLGLLQLDPDKRMPLSTLVKSSANLTICGLPSIESYKSAFLGKRMMQGYYIPVPLYGCVDLWFEEILKAIPDIDKYKLIHCVHYLISSHFTCKCDCLPFDTLLTTHDFMVFFRVILLKYRFPKITY